MRPYSHQAEGIQKLWKVRRMANSANAGAPASRLGFIRTYAAVSLRILAQLALAITIIALPFRYRWVLAARPLPSVYKDYTDLLLFPADIALIATIALWALSWLAKPRRIESGPAFLFWPLAGLPLLGFLSVTSSVDPILSLYHAVRLMLLLGLYLYLVNEIKTLKWVTWAAALQVTIQATVGISQVMRQQSLGLESIGEYPLNPAWNGVSVVVSDGTRWLRAYGVADHPNILGGCLALGLLVIVAWYLSTGMRWSPLIAALFAIGTIGLLLTFSRSAWLAFVSGALALAALLLATRQFLAAQRWLGLMLGGLIVVMPFALSNAEYLGVRLNFNHSFETVASEEQALGERDLLNALARGLIADHAVTGVGLGAFPTALREQAPGYPFNYQPPHHVLLEAATELGLPGALCYFVATIGPWAALIMHRRRLTFSPMLIGVSGLLLAVTAIGLFDYYTWLIMPGRLWQWLIWGLWGAVYQAARQQRS